MNLLTKWANNHLFANKLATFADKILPYGKKCLVFETQHFPWVLPHTLDPTVAAAMAEMVTMFKMVSSHEFLLIK